MIIRLHAMYHRSRQILNFLVAVFLAVTITCGVISVVGNHHVHGGKFVFGSIFGVWGS